MSYGDSSLHHRTGSLDELCGAAMRLQIAGQLDLAAARYHDILRAEPNHAAANHCLGMLHVQRRQAVDGLPYLLRALRENPRSADYWLGYLEALLLAGRHDEATAALQAATRQGLGGAAVEDFAKRLTARRAASPSAPAAVEPAHAAAMHVGPVHAAALAEPVRAAPVHAETGHAGPLHADSARSMRAEQRRAARAAEREENKLLNLVKQRDFPAALALARDHVQRHPDRGLGWKFLGALLWSTDSPAQALPALRRSAALLPHDAEAQTNLGIALTKLQRFDEAEPHLARAAELQPELMSPQVDLGNMYQLQGRHDRAEDVMRRAIALRAADDPDHKGVYSSLLFALSHNPRVNAETLFAEHCRVGASFESGLRAAWPRHLNERDPQRRLKIGFVSGDLCNHPVAHFIEPVLECLHASDGLELHAYSTQPAEDEVSRRLSRHFTGWRRVGEMSDSALARAVTAERIDVLVDLSGHTAGNRLRVFAAKPAPVQASWIGYPGTTGLRAVDYYLAERHFLPNTVFAPQFTEKLVYLPAGVPYRPPASAPPVASLPALRNGRPSYGSFNRLGKINAPTVALWARLLRAIPGATMQVAGVGPEDRGHRLAEWFAAEGIAADRLVFKPHCPLDAYLRLHDEVDVCLDTLPYSGGTTTYHAFWMGVPTLTLAGPTPASRQGAAIMGQLGLEGFVAEHADDFVAKGVHWAAHPAALAELRASLRERWTAAPARRPDLVAAGLAWALRHMWARWCAGLAAESFAVPVAASG